MRFGRFKKMKTIIRRRTGLETWNKKNDRIIIHIERWNCAGKRALGVAL